MSRSVDEIERDIDALSMSNRRRMLKHLVAEFDDRAEPATPRDDIEAAWVAECERRYEEFSRGEVEAIPAEQVFAEARRRLGQAY